uniref:Galectin n=1 Tax=Acrobeloides nanus TaxID=290746 RepID=A0A914EDU8_9BILA
MSSPTPQVGYPTPNNEYSVTTHNDPPLPYVSPFPGGIFPGRAILIRGFIPESAKGHKFQIDLCCGLLVQGDHCDDKAFHFNPRFNVGSSLFKSGDNDIVLNSLIGNKWGAENRY